MPANILPDLTAKYLASTRTDVLALSLAHQIIEAFQLAITTGHEPDALTLLETACAEYRAEQLNVEPKWHS
jgi:hypothetical protein